MKRSHWSVAIFILAVMTSPIVQAASPLDDFNVYFINGLNTNRPDTDQAREQLGILALPDAPSTNIMTLYQKNERFLTELYQVYVQAFTDGNRQKTKNFWIWARDPQNAPDNFLQLVMFPVLRKYDEAAYAADPDLQKLINIVKSNALVRKKTILVSHSQGNFYANQIFNYLDTEVGSNLRGCVGVVAAASPATYVAGDGPYTTLTNDIVINLARKNLPWGSSILKPSPTTPVYNIKDPSGHTYLRSYLEPLTQRIRDQILAVANKVNFSCTTPCPTELHVPADASSITTYGNYYKTHVWTVGSGVHNIIGKYVGFSSNYPSLTIYANGIKVWGSPGDITGDPFNFVFDAAKYETTDLQFYVAQTGIFQSGYVICAGCGAMPATCFLPAPPPPPPPPPVAKTITFNFT